MTEPVDRFRDLQGYILQEQQPVVCEDEEIWRTFMNDGNNLLVAQDTAGKFKVVTVFLGFNYGSAEKPKFFQTTCLGVTSEKRPDYAATWEKAMLRHRGAVKCGEMLTEFETEQAAGIDRSWEFIDCHVTPGELQFILESETEALRVMPYDKKHWKRRGRMIIFCFNELPSEIG